MKRCIGAGSPLSSPIVMYPKDNSRTDEDKDTAASNCTLILNGDVIGEELFLAKHCATEFFYYYVAKADNPDVVVGIAIPPQEASSAWCEVDKKQVGRIACELRANGYIVVGASHSHGSLPAFSSYTDKSTLEELLNENCVVDGCVEYEERITVGTSAEGAQGDGTSRWCLREDGEKEDYPTLIEVSGALPAEPPPHLEVRTCRKVQTRVAFFATINSAGDRVTPAIREETCPTCHQAHRTLIEPGDIEFRVIGDVNEPSSERQAELIRILDENVQPLTGLGKLSCTNPYMPQPLSLGYAHTGIPMLNQYYNTPQWQPPLITDRMELFDLYDAAGQFVCSLTGSSVASLAKSDRVLAQALGTYQHDDP